MTPTFTSHSNKMNMFWDLELEFQPNASELHFIDVS